MLSKEAIEQLFIEIFTGSVDVDNLPRDLYRDTAKKLFDGVQKGYKKKLETLLSQEPDYAILKSFQENIYRFSAAKTFQQVFETQQKIFDEDGYKRAFNKFRDDASEIYDEFNINWLRTEYDTAIGQAQAAEQWQEIEEQKETLPMLTYRTVGDDRVRPEHEALDGFTAPVDDPVWDEIMPPNDFNCYDKETQIYTKRGFILFKDLKSDDYVYTLNIETRIPEWQTPINYIKRQYVGKMVNIQSNNFSLCVTPEHSLLLQKSWDKHEHRDILKLCEAGTIADSDRIYKSTKWKGINCTSITINGKEWDIETYVKFMGWYLSEGSTTKRKGNCYQIKISQSKEKYYSLICEDLKGIPYNVYYGFDYIGINDYNLGIYLKQFGKSYEKYIPEELKNSSPKHLKIFLDRFIKGDGHIQKGQKTISGIIAKDIETIFSSSKRLIDDLTEIILKTGQSCSLHKQNTKGKLVQHRNGKYVCNHDIYRLCISTKQYVTFHKRNIKWIDYDGLVYCVEVPKYNTLLVQRNGKTYWCGNCRCTVEQSGDAEPTTGKEREDAIKNADVNEMFGFNPGKEHIAFSEAHEYFNVPEKYQEYKDNNFNLPLPKNDSNPKDSIITHLLAKLPILNRKKIKLLEFPELRQTFNYDCGVTSLQQVLCYYGIEIRESYLLDDLKAVHTDIFDNGVKLSAIKKYAEKKGLDAEIKTDLVPEDLIPYIDKKIPVIVLLQAWRDSKSPKEWSEDYVDGHYVVAIGYTKNRIIFEDPSSFNRTFLSFNELSERWHDIADDNKTHLSGAAIIITGTPEFKANKISHME